MSKTQHVMGAKERYLNYVKSKNLDAVKAPKIKKISLTISLGALDKKEAAKIQQDLTMLAGQKAQITLAKKSIASFKLREGMIVGASVTLRKDKMYSFIERLVYIALPRVRDFKGLKSSSIDDNHNYSFGLKDSTVFPEVAYNTSLSKQAGIGISFEIANAQSKEEALELLRTFELPIN